jgi:hypothetical protein
MAAVQFQQRPHLHLRMCHQAEFVHKDDIK